MAERKLLSERGGHRRVITLTEGFGLNDNYECWGICRNCCAHCSVPAFVTVEFSLRTNRVILVAYSKRLAHVRYNGDKTIQVGNICHKRGTFRQSGISNDYVGGPLVRLKD